MKNKTILTMTSITLTVLLISLVCAAGVSSPYWKGNPLKISPGQTKVVELTLQNMVGTDDIRMTVEIKQGQNIASLEKNEYLAEIGTKDTEVPVKITIPEDAQIGTTQTIVVGFKSITESTEGTVTFGTAMDTTFDVEITSEAEPEEAELPELNLQWTIIAIVGIIILLIIITFLVKKRK